MSAVVVEALYDAIRSMDQASIAASFSDDLVVIEPPSLPFGGATSGRDEFLEKIVGYILDRASMQLETSEVFGDGQRVVGHFTAKLTAHGSGETFLLNQIELYEVTDSVISRAEIFQYDTPGVIEFFDRNGTTKGNR
jgi:hypothetical protein